MPILVSACQLGLCCRYDGASKPCPAVIEAARKHALIPVCPEIYGGLPTPRPPAERQGDRIVARDGRDVTAEYERGARETLRLARLLGARHAILKEKSPSCGYGRVYDGTFTGALTDGNGLTAQYLQGAGLELHGETQAAAWLQSLESDE